LRNLRRATPVPARPSQISKFGERAFSPKRLLDHSFSFEAGQIWRAQVQKCLPRPTEVPVADRAKPGLGDVELVRIREHALVALERPGKPQAQGGPFSLIVLARVSSVSFAAAAVPMNAECREHGNHPSSTNRHRHPSGWSRGLFDEWSFSGCCAHILLSSSALCIVSLCSSQLPADIKATRTETVGYLFLSSFVLIFFLPRPDPVIDQRWVSRLRATENRRAARNPVLGVPSWISVTTPAMVSAHWFRTSGLERGEHVRPGTSVSSSSGGGAQHRARLP